MKIAILSDIHGNLPALHTVAEHLTAWQPDQVVVNGDSVNRGPSSLAVWQFVQAQPGWHVLKGNHEVYVVGHQSGEAAAENGRLFALNYLSYWTYLQHQCEVTALGQLPDGLSLFAPDDSEVRFRHASMKNNRDSIRATSSLGTLRRQIGTRAAVFATAHTHWTFVRQVDATLVVNSGSVGTPADDDPRASYAQLTWQHGQWSAQIIRLPYDRGAACQAYKTSGFLAEAGPVGWLVFHEWQQAREIVYTWLKLYYKAIMAGEIKLETAVIDHLTKLQLPLPA